MQPVHRRAVCDGLPDRGDVQAARRHRRLRQGDLHRLQGLHGGLPLRRDLHQPRRPLGREVQHVRPSNRRGTRARLRLGVPNRGDHRRRRQRPDIQGGPTRGAPPRAVRRPEKETGPGVFYLGAHQATLDPLGSARPEGGLYAWATQGAPDPQLVTAGHPQGARSSAAALLSYDIPHHAPWGWRVSLYTWTKSIAAGAFLVAALLALTGLLDWSDGVTRWVAPVVALVFLGITGVLLIWDLKHPLRFYLIFTKHHWSSWLVKGAFIIGGYGGIVVLYLAASMFDVPRRRNRFSACSGSSSARDGVLHRLPLRPGQGPRPLAEPAAARASCRAGGTRGRGGAVAVRLVALTGRRCARARGGARGRRGRPPPPRLDGDEPAARHRPRRPCHPRDGPGPLLAGLHGGRRRGGRRDRGAVDRRRRRSVRSHRVAGARARLRAGRPIRPTCLRRSLWHSHFPPAPSGCRPPARTSRPAAKPSTRAPAACTCPRFRPRNAGTTGSRSSSKAWPRREEHHYMLVPTTCFNCESACGLLAYVDRDDLHVRKFEGNPEHPGSRGRNCAKGPSTLNQVTDPDRILYPLRRVGERGSGQWERVSWDDALDAIAARIRRGHRRGTAQRDHGEHRQARRGRLHRKGAGQLGRRRAQLAHQRLLERRSHRLPVLDGHRPAQPRPRQRQGDLPDQLAPGNRPLLQPARPAHHRGEGERREDRSCSTPGCPTPPRTPITGCRRSPAARPRSTWPSRDTSSSRGRYDREFVRQWWNWEEYLQTCRPDLPADFASFEAALATLYDEFTFDYAAAESGIDAATLEEVAETVAGAGTRFSSHSWRSAAASNLGGWQVAARWC